MTNPAVEALKKINLILLDVGRASSRDMLATTVHLARKIAKEALAQAEQTPVADVAKAGRVVGVNEMRGMMIAYGMRAVANETGVSPSTVSRFCAGHDIYLSVYLPLLNWCSSKIAAPVYHKEDNHGSDR